MLVCHGRPVPIGGVRRFLAFRLFVDDDEL